MEVYIQCQMEVVLFWIERVAARKPDFRKGTLHHASDTAEHNVDSDNISETTPPLKSDRLTLHIIILLIIM